MKITGIQHLNLPVSELEVSLRFYRDIMGMKVLHREEERVFLTAGEGLFTLEKSSKLLEEPFHFGFHLPNLEVMEKWKEWLDLRGWGWEDFQEMKNGASLYLRDPDKYKIELYYWPGLSVQD